MSHLAPVTIALLCAAGLLLALERGWRARLWRHREERARAQLDAARATSASLATQLRAAQDRKKELEALVMELSSHLERKGITSAERHLLNDIYHDYGTETHALIFAGEGNEN